MGGGQENGQLAIKAARAEQDARAPQARPPGSSHPWTFGEVLTDWEERHRDSVQESTMRDYGPALNDLRQAVGGVRAGSLTDEHFDAYKRAKLHGVDVNGCERAVPKLAASTVNKRLDLAPACDRRRNSPRDHGSPQPGAGGRAPKRTQARADGADGVRAAQAARRRGNARAACARSLLR